MIRATLVILAALAVVSVATAAAPTGESLPSFPITNGSVYATALSGSTLYIGGDFTYVGPNTGGFAAVDTSTSEPSASIPVTDGDVYATVPDGGGGWFIGGFFSSVGGVARGSLAHITAAGDVDESFDAGVDGAVNALARSADGATLYVAGAFGEVGGTPRSNLAALSTATGDPTAFDPNANNEVLAIALSPDGQTLYAGGNFTSIGGQFRTSIAAVSSATGLATSFDANLNNNVQALAVSSDGATLYAGGAFSTISGQVTRNHIAAFNTSTGNVTPFDPNASAHVSALALSDDDSVLYAGGGFGAIGGQARNYIAALSTTDGTATPFDPNVQGGTTVGALALSDDESTLYAGGDFTSIGGQSRRHLAAVSTAAGTATSFDPGAEEQVDALAVSGSTLGVGGEFVSVGGKPRKRIAAIDVSTMEVTSFDPEADNVVRSLAVSGDGSTVYAGGNFGSIGGENIDFFAALSAADGTLDSSFNPDASGVVETLALSGDSSTVYAGGSFSTIGGVSREGLAALSAADGSADVSFDATSDGFVSAVSLSSDGSVLYVAGGFGAIGGENRPRLAALSAADGSAVTSFDAQVTDPEALVDALALSSDDATLYAGGTFSAIGGQSRTNLAALATATGDATAFNPNANGAVGTLALSGDDSTLYAGGAFTSVGGQSRNRLAALQTSSGNATSFNPNVNDDVRALALSGDDSTLYAGGDFSTVGSITRRSLVSFPDFPETTINSGPANPMPKTATATFTFSSDTGGATFECRLDLALFSACSSGQSYPSLSSGPHTFRVRSVAGSLTDPSPSIFAWTVLSADGSGTMAGLPTAVSALSQHQTIAFTYTAATGGMAGGAITLTVPSGWSAPSATGIDPGFTTASKGSVSVDVASRTITVSGLTRAAGEKVTVTYGAKASGGPGASAPSTPQVQTWNAKEKSSAGGALMPLSSSPSIRIYARDGSGTLTGSTTGVSALSQHNTITFTYTAANGGLGGGTVTLAVPSGWSAPSTTGTAAGFAKVNHGTLSLAGRTIVVSGLTLTGGQTLTIIYGSKALGGPGATAPSTTGPQTWSASERSTAAGTLTPLNSSPSITVYARDGSGTLTTPTSSVVHGSTGKTITFTYTTASGGIKNGQVTLTVPSGWSAPSTTGTARGFVKASLGTVSISSRTIVVSGLTRSGGQTFTITYGSKASGGPGATAPGTAVGTQTWQAKEKSIPGGVLTNLGSSPKITVT